MDRLGLIGYPQEPMEVNDDNFYRFAEALTKGQRHRFILLNVYSDGSDTDSRRHSTIPQQRRQRLAK